eukprot:TRINITY_DN4869_c0_g1_i1.p1 TRINITY_DN4869_c0_g1~~TRINITY_DN4869_c0_g1_i1.p1  ORF type:complete len:143 (-),score=32.36 TRINITY_DN4869_c0_g1_i1:142-570(-)
MPALKSLALVRHLEQLIKLQLPAGQYAVFGSAVLAAHGLRENYDLDVVVSASLFESLLKKGYTPTPTNASVIRIDDWLEIVKDWTPTLSVGVDKLIADAEIIDGIPFVQLSYLVESKKLRNKEKDQRDLALIESLNATTTEL